MCSSSPDSAFSTFCWFAAWAWVDQHLGHPPMPASSHIRQSEHKHNAHDCESTNHSRLVQQGGQGFAAGWQLTRPNADLVVSVLQSLCRALAQQLWSLPDGSLLNDTLRQSMREATVPIHTRVRDCLAHDTACFT